MSERKSRSMLREEARTKEQLAELNEDSIRGYIRGLDFSYLHEALAPAREKLETYVRFFLERLPEYVGKR